MHHPFYIFKQHAEKMLESIGTIVSTLQKWISDSLWPHHEVLMVGVAGVGKTTALYQLVLGE
jgi:flagellar biosynthesis GTPase FlhF